MKRFLLPLLLLAGCATTGVPPSRMDDGWAVRRVPAGDGAIEMAWTVDGPGSGWLDERDRTSEFTWIHRDQAATIYADSTCGDPAEDVPLTVLLNHQTFGFEDLETLAQVEVDLAGRGGLQRIFDATLDGRPVRVGLTAVRKGPCVFDVVFVHANRDRFEGLLPDYQTVVESLRIKERAT